MKYGGVLLHKKLIAFAFVIYIVITLGIMFAHNNYPKFFELDQNFYTSFIASSWEDVIFFGIVGLALALVSLSDPSKAIFVQRIKNLFSFKEDVGSLIQNAVIDSVKKVAIYSRKNDISLTILEYNKDMDSIKVQIRQEIYLTNLLQDEPYSYSRAVDFILDDFGDKKPDILGRISEASFLDDVLNKVTFCDTGRAFSNQKYSFNIEENIAKGGHGMTTLNYWIWYKIGEDWNFKVHHHTEELNISVINDDVSLKDKLKLTHAEDQITLNNHEQQLLLNEFYPINSKVHFKIDLIK
jgi:hypothetical protein